MNMNIFIMNFCNYIYLRLFSLCIFLPAIFYILQCATLVPVTISRYPRKNGAQLRNVLEGHRNVAVVAVKADAQTVKKLGKKVVGNWDETMEAAVGKYLGEFGFYNIVDVSSRKKRLQELAYSQSGLTQESLEIGRDLQIHIFLFLRMTRPPKIECKIEEVEDLLAKTVAVTVRAILKHPNVSNVHVGRKTGVLYVSAFVEGKLTNVETGLSTIQFFTTTVRIPSDTGNRVCTSPYKSFENILAKAGLSIANSLSPKLYRLDVPLMGESPDLKSPLHKRIQPYLETGLKWAESGEMNEAKIQWEEAMKLSNKKSAAAIWNLAIYYWHVGKNQKALLYFNRFKREKPHYLDSQKRRIVSIFNEELNIK